MGEAKARTARADDQLFYDAFKSKPYRDYCGGPRRAAFIRKSGSLLELGFSEEEMRRKHYVEFSPPEDAAKDWF